MVSEHTYTNKQVRTNALLVTLCRAFNFFSVSKQLSLLLVQVDEIGPSSKPTNRRGLQAGDPNAESCVSTLSGENGSLVSLQVHAIKIGSL